MSRSRELQQNQECVKERYTSKGEGGWSRVGGSNNPTVWRVEAFKSYNTGFRGHLHSVGFLVHLHCTSSSHNLLHVIIYTTLCGPCLINILRVCLSGIMNRMSPFRHSGVSLCLCQGSIFLGLGLSGLGSSSLPLSSSC